MKKITQEDEVKLQKAISIEMLDVAIKPCCPNRHELLKELNLRLDSLNRAIFYLQKDKN